MKKYIYQVIGWYPNIPEDKQNSHNISDGALLPTYEDACEYVKTFQISKPTIKAIEVEEISEATVKHFNYCLENIRRQKGCA